MEVSIEVFKQMQTQAGPLPDRWVLASTNDSCCRTKTCMLHERSQRGKGTSARLQIMRLC